MTNYRKLIGKRAVGPRGSLVAMPLVATAMLVAVGVLVVSLATTAWGQTSPVSPDWPAQAKRKYPDLGVQGSALNQRFVAAVLERRRTQPAFFSDPRWPLLLADELMRPKPVVTPPPPGLPVSISPPAPTSPASTPSTAEFDAGNLPSACGLVSAKFRWWSPPGAPVRGVVVLLEGRNGDSRAMTDEAEWQTLAARAHFGLTGAQLVNPPNDTSTFQGDPNGMISDLIGKAVNALLLQTGQKLKDPPLAFWGHSAGGNLAQQYMSRHANRVIGAALVRATEGPGGLAPGKDHVPTLICVGGKDKPEWIKAAGDSYEKGRRMQAQWTLALKSDEGHEVGRTRPLAMAYLAAAIHLRLPESAGSSIPGGESSAKPVPLTKQFTWLGDPANYEIAAYEKYTGRKPDAVWLPDETTARAWQEYLRAQAGQ